MGTPYPLAEWEFVGGGSLSRYSNTDPLVADRKCRLLFALIETLEHSLCVGSSGQFQEQPMQVSVPHSTWENLIEPHRIRSLIDDHPPDLS